MVLNHQCGCLSHFSTAIKRHQDQAYLEKKMLVEAHSSRGLESIIIMTVCVREHAIRQADMVLEQ